MGRQYLQQPDGKWAIYSTITDQLVAISLTEDELIAVAMDEAKEKAERDTREYLEAKRNGGKTSPFSVDWAEAVMDTRRVCEDPEFLRAVIEIGT